MEQDGLVVKINLKKKSCFIFLLTVLFHFGFANVIRIDSQNRTLNTVQLNGLLNLQINQLRNQIDLQIKQTELEVNRLKIILDKLIITRNTQINNCLKNKIYPCNTPSLLPVQNAFTKTQTTLKQLKQKLKQLPDKN